MQPFGADNGKAGVGIPQNQHGVGLDLRHQLIAFGDDVAHGLAKVAAHGVQIDLRVRQFQILEEHPVQVVVIILAGVGKNGVEINAAFFDDGGQTDDLRPGAHDDEQL